MSSYIESAYVIEERRLNGIVQQCCDAVESAKKKVDSQKNQLRELQIAKEEYRKSYVDRKNKLMDRYYAAVEKEASIREQNKRKLLYKISGYILEMETYQEIYDCSFSGMERMQSIRTLVESKLDDYSGIEREIRQIMKKTRDEMFDRTCKVFRGEIKDKISSPKSVGHHMVTLEKGIEKENDENTEKPADAFLRIIGEVKNSPFFDEVFRNSSIINSFYEQRVYERDLYALKNMDKLIEMCERIKQIEKRKKAKDQKTKEEIKTYIALCGLLGFELDEKLISDSCNEMILEKKNKSLLEEYIKKKRHDYVSGAIRKVMEKRNIVFQDGNNPDEMVFSMENAGLVITGYDSDRLEIQQVGTFFGESPSSNDKRKSISTAKRFCTLMEEIREELISEYGVSFEGEYIEEPNEENMVMCRQKQDNSKNWYVEAKRFMGEQ